MRRFTWHCGIWTTICLDGDFSCYLPIRTSRRIDAEGLPTRSSAREYVAEQALSFLMKNGFWKRLDDAGICDGELEKAMWKTFDS